MDLTEIMQADKQFALRPVWKPRDRDWLFATAPLKIDSVVIEGLKFRATALSCRPDESMTFQLEYFPPIRGIKGGAVARIEWRPIRPHNNKGVGPEELKFLSQNGTHHHPFDLNWEHSPDQVKKGSLPISVPIDPEPSFPEIVELVGKEFKIGPVDWITPPPLWQLKALV